MSKLHSDQGGTRLFESHADRIDIEIPADYLPEAGGVLIAGPDMLRGAGYFSGCDRPPFWTQTKSGMFLRRYTGKRGRKFWVQKFGDYWFIERSFDTKSGLRRTIETLTFALEPLLICTHTAEAAMLLANYCNPRARPPVPACWVRVWQIRLINGRYVCTP